MLREEDFREPGRSDRLRELWELPDENTRRLVGHLILACLSEPDQTPRLADLVPDPSRPEVRPLSRHEQAKVEQALRPAPVAVSPTTTLLPPSAANLPLGPAPVTPTSQPPAPLFPRSTGNSLQRRKRPSTQPLVLYSLIAVGMLFIGSFPLLLLILLAGGPSSETKPARTGLVSQVTVKTAPHNDGSGTKPAGAAAPIRQTWRVSPGGLSLPEAVQKARPGDIIEIAAGEYTLRQPLVIDKSLTLRGAGRDQTRLLCWRPDFVIKFTGDGQWTLQGLTVEHAGIQWANVVVVEGGFITITDCVLTGGLRDQQSEQGGNGVWFTGTARGYVARCLCRNNELHGIAVSGQAQPRLEDNTCEDNTGSGIAYVENASGTVRNNTCRNNGIDGIGVNGQAQPTLEGNTCENNRYSGIAYFENARGSARNNTCRNNERYGIFVQKGAKPMLDGNILQGNREGDLHNEQPSWAER
ncbi:hypothetical protein HRbin36_02754 [bacterium HR36]|nr:hypothetical protein HRbin36_02754 [bacterium HR36]